jgi:hypothetical protein
MNLLPVAVLMLLVTCSYATSMERAIKSLVLPRSQADARMIYLHSSTINTLKSKDLRTMDESDDNAQHFQYLIHVDYVNSDYTQRITAQIEEWGGQVVYL